jgi:ADP-ribose pyrophosphatase YjhB (NUDIX family)
MKRDYPDRPIIGVGAVIVQDEQALLVCRDTEPLKGEWSVPGGVLELGEKLREGVRREALEETCLEIEPAEVLDVFDSIFTNPEGRTQYHYVLIDYLCRVVSGEARAGSDVSALKWVALQDLPALHLRDSIEQVVRQALGANHPSLSHPAEEAAARLTGVPSQPAKPAGRNKS